jgi:hypothetical protein
MASKKSNTIWILAALAAVYYFFFRNQPTTEDTQAVEEAERTIAAGTAPDVSNIKDPKVKVVDAKKGHVKHTEPVKHNPSLTSSSGNVGIEANNPFNLRQTKKSQHWQGEIGTIFAGDKDKVGFVRFDTPENGARACLKNMLANIKAGHTTIADYIKKESPASDGNNPNAYADHVASKIGMKATDKLDEDNLTEIADFAVAINGVEWGHSELSADLFEKEYLLLKPDAKPAA